MPQRSSALAGLPLASLVMGAQADNMAPSKSHQPAKAHKTPILPVADPRLTVLHQGIDTLVLNYYGTLKEDVAECLEIAKEDAQAHPSGEALSPLPPFDGATPLMQSSGVKYYQWRLVSPDVTVLVAKPSRSKRPKAVVRVSSQCLWRMGGGGRVAGELAAVYLLDLFEPGAWVQVSQVHMATDYQGYVVTVEDQQGIVKRARVLGEHLQFDGDGIEWYGRKGGPQSLSAGKSNAIRLNLYDKRAEIDRSGKEWFSALWERSKGYVAGAPVWRLEYQFGRALLHDRGIDSLSELFNGLAGLWSFGVRWFSFREVNPRDLLHPSRWPVAAWWVALSAWCYDRTEPLPKVAQVRPKFKVICQGGFGYLTSVMALMEIDDPYEALDKLLDVVRSHKGALGMQDALLAKQRRYFGFTMASA